MEMSRFNKDYNKYFYEVLCDQSLVPKIISFHEKNPNIKEDVYGLSVKKSDHFFL